LSECDWFLRVGGWGHLQVNVRLRKMVEAQCPEAVGRRRAEEVKALTASELMQLCLLKMLEAMEAQLPVAVEATAELLRLVPNHPPTESHQALVQVCHALPNRVRPILL
jgi:hypothetical protein